MLEYLAFFYILQYINYKHKQENYIGIVFTRQSLLRGKWKAYQENLAPLWIKVQELQAFLSTIMEFFVENQSFLLHSRNWLEVQIAVVAVQVACFSRTCDCRHRSKTSIVCVHLGQANIGNEFEHLVLLDKGLSCIVFNWHPLQKVPKHKTTSLVSILKPFSLVGFSCSSILENWCRKEKFGFLHSMIS